MDARASTVRDIVDTLSQRERTGYTSVLKMLQIMAEKGLVVRNESRRSHIYAAAKPEEATQREMVGGHARPRVWRFRHGPGGRAP